MMRVLFKHFSAIHTGWICLLALLLGPAAGLHAQSGSPTDYHALVMQNDPAYQQNTEAFLASVFRYMSELQGQAPSSPRAILTIPVVVHIMHLPQDNVPDNSTSNLTDGRIIQAIDYLNDAFRNSGVFWGDPQHTNAGIPAADVEIEFCLAKFDPQGNPHSGINRVPTPLSNLQRDEECASGGTSQDLCLKNLSRWNTNDFLNIWVVNNICVDAAGNCLINGYSLLPSAHGTDRDGIVIEAAHMGSSPGLTTDLVHEAGTYLGLFDTYHQGTAVPNSCINTSCLAYGDGICDTPPDASRAVLDCSIGERVNSCSSDADDQSANNPFTTDVEDIYENFMDDGAPGCRNSFTPMQAVRMRFGLTNGRGSLLTNPVCKSTFENAGFGRWIRPPVITCDSLIRPQVQLYNGGDDLITSVEFWQRVDNLSPSSWTWTGSLQPGDTIVIDLPAKFLPAGQHQWDVRILQINDAGPDDERSDNRKILDFFRLPGSPPVTDYPFCEEVELGLYDFKEINWDGKVGFDFYSWAGCLGTTGKYVVRYNSSGVWEGGAGIGAGPSGTRDMLVSRPFDLTEFNTADFSFVTAWKETFPENAVEMKVWVLPGCDQPAELVYTQSADDLNSSNSPFAPGIIGWIPSGCEDWMSHNISLDKYAGQVVRVIIELVLESEFTQNFYLDQFCMDAAVVCPVPGAIPEQSGVYLADTACVAPDGWTHFWKYASSTPQTSEDVLLFSVFGLDSSQLDLPPEGVSMVLASQAGQGMYDMSGAPYVNNSEGWFVAGRYWNLAPSSGQDSLRVRIYFNDQDLADLATSGVEMSGGLPPITVFRIGSNPDPAQGHEGVSKELWQEFDLNPLISGQWSWEIFEMGEYYASEFLLKEWDGLGFGVSGDGKGMGPTYPAEITITEAIQNQAQVTINWEVPRERFGQEYQIWRKTDAEEEFQIIATVPAGGNSWESQVFSFQDPSPYEGMAEYFVALTHDAPLVAYSDTVELRFDLSKLVTAFPNPTTGTIWFAAGTEQSEPVHAAIYNAAWQLLAEQSWRNSSGEELPFNLSFAPPGVYFYVVRFIRNGELFEVRGKILLVPGG